MPEEQWRRLKDIGVSPGDRIISRSGVFDGWVVNQAMIDIWQYPDYAKMEEEPKSSNDNRNS